MSGYPNTLKYFIWPFQVHFRISCDTRAEAIFNHFDRGLDPKTYMLGFLSDNMEEMPPICYEPERIDYLHPLFANLHEKAKEIREMDPYKDMHYTGPGMQKEMDIRRSNDSYRKAVEAILNESSDADQRIFFVSKHVFFDKYYVFVVLSLTREIYHSHTHLKIEFVHERTEISKSVLETAVDIFLSDCVTNLHLPNPGKRLSDETRSTDDIIRQAAKVFMYTVAAKGDEFHGLHGLFEACNNISIHRYEGKENTGQIFIANSAHPDIEFTLQLEEPFRLSEFRKTRKMLQLAAGNIGIISNSYKVLGLGKIKDTYDAASESIFVIKFRGIHCWEVVHDEQQLLIMRYGLPYFPSEVINKSKFFSDCKRLFKSVSSSQIENLYKLAMAATNQKNGALLVVTADAQSEATRLSKQSIPIKPIKLDDEMILSLTSIDGGVLVDVDGIAFAHGVILDGIVGNTGDSSRGSRFNSAITYHDFKGKEIPTLIVVVSEDGMVDIIPFLRPQIARKEINAMIELMEKMKDEGDNKNLGEVMSWFRSREFYLSAEQCTQVNKLRKEIESHSTSGTIRFVYSDLCPHSEMNETYFLDD